MLNVNLKNHFLRTKKFNMKGMQIASLSSFLPSPVINLIFNLGMEIESLTAQKMWIGRSVFPLSGSLSPLSMWPGFELWTVNLTWKMTIYMKTHHNADDSRAWPRPWASVSDPAACEENRVREVPVVHDKVSNNKVWR